MLTTSIRIGEVCQLRPPHITRDAVWLKPKVSAPPASLAGVQPAYRDASVVKDVYRDDDDDGGGGDHDDHGDDDGDDDDDDAAGRGYSPPPITSVSMSRDFRSVLPVVYKKTLKHIKSRPARDIIISSLPRQIIIIIIIM